LEINIKKMTNPEKSSSGAASIHLPGPSATPGKNRSLLKWALLVLPLGYLWFHLIDNLFLEWTTDPQYSYGLVVPLLMVGLLLRRWQHIAGHQCASVAGNPWLTILLCGLLAFLYLPTRLIEAATPEWRPVQWSLGIQIVGLTLYAVYLAGGKGWLKQAIFPVSFFLVAIPWPTLIEAPIIQGLSRMNAAMVVDVLGILNVPAIQHGNVIEVSTGIVGINDACSGIRSLQSSLMVSLFLGEFYFLGWRRRLLLIPISFVLAMILNLCRTSLLTWIAAKKGIGAIAEYHDEAGWTILLVCTAMLWAAGWLLNRRNVPHGDDKTAATDDLRPMDDDNGDKARRRMNRLGIILMIWLVAVESGVELWYRIRESHLKPGPAWSVNFPEANPTYKSLPLTTEEHELLRFDQGQQGQWQEPDGTMWQAFYFNWLPGRVAGYLAKRHTPDICITATGYNMISGPTLMVLNVNNVELPMRHYVFASSIGSLQVYQCHWEAGMGKDTYTANESSRFNLIRGIWAGRGNKGQKVLEIIIVGYNDPELARQALMRQLVKLIKVEN
jgi:exosortase